MYYNNTLTITNNLNDSFFIVLAIITITVVLYAIGFSEISRKKIEKLKEAKRIAVAGLNIKHYGMTDPQSNDEYEEDDEYYE